MRDVYLVYLRQGFTRSESGSGHAFARKHLW